jgi:hypothetical protein
MKTCRKMRAKHLLRHAVHFHSSGVIVAALIRLDDFEISTNCIDGVETVLFFGQMPVSDIKSLPRLGLGLALGLGLP